MDCWRSFMIKISHHDMYTRNHYEEAPDNFTVYVKGAVLRNSTELGNYKMPIKLRDSET